MKLALKKKTTWKIIPDHKLIDYVKINILSKEIG